MHRIGMALALVLLAAPVSPAAAEQRAQAAQPAITPEDRVLGSPDAPVTIFEYASLTCPHCARFANEVLPKVKQNWIDTGKARLVFRDFPFDQLGLRAAVLARCAPPTRFFPFVDYLFKDQANWAQMRDQTLALERAANLGDIPKDTAAACLRDTKTTDYVVGERFKAEKEYGVNATPTFFIKGNKLVGEQSYADFDKALNAALAQR